MLDLSLRVRGNPAWERRHTGFSGSIPACAGEPIECKPEPVGIGVYPRVCGGTPSSLNQYMPASGLSPRVRGNPK